MKAPFLFIALVFTAGAAAGNDTLPAALPASRYEKLAQHSPFFPPSAGPPPPPPAAKAPGWADSLYISGGMKDGNTYLLTIVDRENAESFHVSTDPAETNTRNVTLTSVQWSDVPYQIQATVQRGTEFAVLKCDTSNASPGVVRSAGSPIPGVPRAPGAPLPNRSQVFNAPPSQGAAPNAMSRNQIIRATPPPIQRTTPPALPRAQPPGTKVRSAAGDDDDDDDE